MGKASSVPANDIACRPARPVAFRKAGNIRAPAKPFRQNLPATDPMPASRFISSLRIRGTGKLLAFLIAGMAAHAAADDSVLPLLGRIASAHASAIEVLSDQYTLEQDLLKPQSDRVQVFFSLRNAEKLALSEVEFFLDGSRVVAHSYTPAERNRLKNRAVQMLYAGRLAPGNHTVRVVARLESGDRVATETLRLVKAQASRYIEFQLEGEPVRVLTVLQW